MFIKNHLSLLLYLVLFLLLIGCSSSSVKITGKIRNGLDGIPIAGAKITLLETSLSTTSNSNGEFILKLPIDITPDIIVEKYDKDLYLKPGTLNRNLNILVEKGGFQQLTYSVAEKINDLTIGLMPEPEHINTELVSADYIPSTNPIEENVDWENIIDGVRKFHEDRLMALKPLRERYWNRDLSSPDSYNASIELNRQNFRTIIGAVDEREPVLVSEMSNVAETTSYIVSEIQWTVLKEVTPRPALQDWPQLDVPKKIFGEGLLLEPKEKSKGFVIAIPDADQDPESLVGLKEGVDNVSQFARRMVENGYTVVVPVIADRSNMWSRGTNRSSRSWIYAQSHEMGRTITGYEVQKMEALVDWFQSLKDDSQKIGIAGYGEGALLAFYTAALDTRVDAVLVSGYFAPREEIWKEPIYRNLWGLLKEFGDAEIASLIAPRSLVVEYSEVPFYDGAKNSGKQIDPPGELWTHEFHEVNNEFNRISELIGNFIGERHLIKSESNETVPFGSEESVNTLMSLMGSDSLLALSEEIPVDVRENFDYIARMGRMVEQMVGHTQMLLRDSEYKRADFVQKWSNQEELRDFYREEMIGWTNQDFLPINPRSKKVEDCPEYSVYEVLIDVLPNIEMWGVMLIPKNIEQGEKRPVVVLQHGRGGNPYTSLVETNTYYGVSRRLAEKGFVVFSPFGNWTGETQFRWIDRIAKPSKNTLWSTVGRQHQQLIRWLSTLPFVDEERIGLYGKSIGGQAASLIASMLPEYALSINCAYFNEGARKESSVYFPTSFVFHVDSEMPMWNRGHTLEYAEMSNMLIFPRPFMVEHGKKDGIAPQGWVEHEYSKVKDYYTEKGKGEYTELDLHDGGHIINGIVSIPFIQKYLEWQDSIN